MNRICHGTDPRLLMLASQHVDYRQNAPHDCCVRTHKGNEMTAMSDGLSEKRWGRS